MFFAGKKGAHVRGFVSTFSFLFLKLSSPFVSHSFSFTLTESHNQTILSHTYTFFILLELDLPWLSPCYFRMTIRLLVQVGHNKILQKVKSLVVSIGANPTFKVELVPMEYIPTIPPLSHYVCMSSVILSRTLFLCKKYNKNIDDVR